MTGTLSTPLDLIRSSVALGSAIAWGAVRTKAIARAKTKAGSERICFTLLIVSPFPRCAVALLVPGLIGTGSHPEAGRSPPRSGLKSRRDWRGLSREE